MKKIADSTFVYHCTPQVSPVTLLINQINQRNEIKLHESCPIWW